MSNVTVWALSLVIGIIASLTASGLFLLAISRLRPKFDISPVISKAKDHEGKTAYYVKVVNRTRSPVIGVKVRMSIAVPQNAPGGTIHYNLKPLRLKTDEVMEVEGYNRKDKAALYAVRFTIDEDLDALWPEDGASWVRFQIYATHSLTGFGKAKEQEYHHKRTELVEKDFKFGDSLDTV